MDGYIFHYVTYFQDFNEPKCLNHFVIQLLFLHLLFIADGDLPGVGAVLGSHDFTPKETGTPCVFKVTRGDYSDLMALVVENLTKAEVKT